MVCAIALAVGVALGTFFTKCVEYSNRTEPIDKSKIAEYNNKAKHDDMEDDLK